MRIKVTAVNKYEGDGEVNHVRCKMLFSPPLNLVNFEAVIANLIRELCHTVSRDKALRCLSVCWLGVQDDHISHIALTFTVGIFSGYEESQKT